MSWTTLSIDAAVYGTNICQVTKPSDEKKVFLSRQTVEFGLLKGQPNRKCTLKIREKTWPEVCIVRLKKTVIVGQSRLAKSKSALVDKQTLIQSRKSDLHCIMRLDWNALDNANSKYVDSEVNVRIERETTSAELRARWLWRGHLNDKCNGHANQVFERW